MNIKPIIIVNGEPYSIFFEIFFKVLRKKKFKKPLIFIGSYELLKKQSDYFKYKISTHKINENFNFNELKKNKINIINVNFKFKKTFDKISNISNSYIENCFKISLKLAKKKMVSGIINGPISKKHFLKKKYLGVTEYIANKTKTKKFGMLIFNENFSVSPITTHVSLKDVPKLVNKKKNN